MYNVYVEDFMVRDIKYIYHNMSYEQLKAVLKENRRLQSFPLADTPDNMVLLGSIQRIHLIQLIDQHIGRERRLQVSAYFINKLNKKKMSLLLLLLNQQ